MFFNSSISQSTPNLRLMLPLSWLHDDEEPVVVVQFGLILSRCRVCLGERTRYIVAY